MDQELKTLLYAAFGQLFFAALGISFARLTDSAAIMLDGFFSLIGFGMSLLTMRELPAWSGSPTTSGFTSAMRDSSRCSTCSRGS